jgi:hypothetical protein
MTAARYVKGPSGFVNLSGGGGLSFPQNVERTAAGVTVTASASTNTKGAWTELIASTDADATWLYVKPIMTTTNASDTSFLLDIGTGAAASETVRIANIGCGYHNTVGPGFIFPISVPSGTRIAARGQSNITVRTCAVSISVLNDASAATLPTTLDTIGADTAASRGTNLPTSDTYVQLTASTSQAYQALVAVPTGTGNVFAGEDVTFTVASGGAGSETALTNFVIGSTTQEALPFTPPTFSTVYVGSIAAGTRLAVKQSIGRNYRDVILYGVPA